ncbi:MAG TPA: Fe-S cluster assembly protein SufD [Amoebophilaceae bacterium]|nr:Fe-S cluster assembly protein SufD [Amoebophilaceae bacterium]
MKPFFDLWLTKVLQELPPHTSFYTERCAAYHALQDPAFRKKQNEAYSYVPLQELLDGCTRQPYQAQIAVAQALTVPPLPYNGVAHTITFVNGTWIPTHPTVGTIHPTLQLRRLSALSPIQQAETIQRYLPDLTQSEDFLAALHTLLAQETYLLDIPPHTQIDGTIVIQHVLTEGNAYVAPQLIVTVGQESQATMVEHWTGPGASVAHPLVHITLAEAAKLTYHTLHTQSTPCSHLYQLHCNQQTNSTFVHHAFSFGSRLLRLNATVQLQGQHTSTNLYGLYAPNTNEKVDQRICVQHHFPESCSMQHYKGVVGKQATGVFRGKTYVSPEAQQTNAYQTNQALLLSEEAHHYAKPQLEIYADAVKCSHGATAGQLDPEHIFYLQARGIHPIQAKQLLLEAFGKEIICTVEAVDVRTYIQEKLYERLTYMLQ